MPEPTNTFQDAPTPHQNAKHSALFSDMVSVEYRSKFPLSENLTQHDVRPLVESDEKSQVPSSGLDEATSTAHDSIANRLKRMRIVMMDRATPLVLSGPEIIGSAFERLGGDKMVHIDYLKFEIRGTQIPIPVLVPVTFFGGEIANVQKFIQSQYDALAFIIEEKASLIMKEKDRLPSYLRLEEMNVENAQNLCRQQIAAAQIFVECKKNQTTENLEWARNVLLDTIRNQYEDWKSLGQETTERLTTFLCQLKERAAYEAPTSFATPSFPDANFGQINEVLKEKAMTVFARVVQDELVQSVVTTSQGARCQIDQWSEDVRKQTYRVMDFEMMSFARDYLQSVLHTARETFEPHMHAEIIQTVMLQTGMLLSYMKARVDTLLELWSPSNTTDHSTHKTQ